MNKIAPNHDEIGLRPSAPPNLVEIDPESSVEVSIYTFDKIEDQEKHVDKAIRTLYDVMNDTSSRNSEKITAAKTILEACGKLGKGNTTNIIRANNAQINNSKDKDENKDLLAAALSGLTALAGAKDPEISIHKGGKGI